MSIKVRPSYFKILSKSQVPISPLKYLLAVILPVFMAFRGLEKRSLTISGAIAAMVVGFVMTVVNYCFISAMLSFYILASKATKYKMDIKSEFEKDPEKAAARNWVQVLCNGGVATQMALFYYLEVGCLETTIDFESNYLASWWIVNVIAAVACSCGDTFASELGPVLPFSQPYLVTSFRRVPKGTNGGVSLAGTISSAVGGLVVGIASYISIILSVPTSKLLSSPPQWPIIIVATVAGMFGSFIDSLLGATLQYSGVDDTDNCIVEHPGAHISHISGSAILDNHAVNLLSSFLTSITITRFAFHIWGYMLLS